MKWGWAACLFLRGPGYGIFLSSQVDDRRGMGLGDLDCCRGFAMKYRLIWRGGSWFLTDHPKLRVYAMGPTIQSVIDLMHRRLEILRAI